MLFPNLPVKDLERSKAFYAALGFTFNAQFTDDNAACVVINDLTSVMLLRHDFWRTFTTKPIPDAHAVAGVFMAYSVDSREEVVQQVEIALASGGSAASPQQDHGFMFGWSFHDPDGHHWEPFWMNPEHLQPTT